MELNVRMEMDKDMNMDTDVDMDINIDMDIYIISFRKITKARNSTVLSMAFKYKVYNATKAL